MIVGSPRLPGLLEAPGKASIVHHQRMASGAQRAFIASWYEEPRLAQDALGRIA
jgi:hypothetical protein